jgi:hypothetical protein
VEISVDRLKLEIHIGSKPDEGALAGSAAYGRKSFIFCGFWGVQANLRQVRSDGLQVSQIKGFPQLSRAPQSHRTNLRLIAKSVFPV